MAKAKKSPARKPSSRPAPLVNSLPPQILEQAAQGWLKSTGTSDPAASFPKTAQTKADSLVECLDATLKNLRAEIAELRDRLARLEGRSH